MMSSIARIGATTHWWRGDSGCFRLCGLNYLVHADIIAALAEQLLSGVRDIHFVVSNVLMVLECLNFSVPVLDGSARWCITVVVRTGWWAETCAPVVSKIAFSIPS